MSLRQTEIKMITNDEFTKAEIKALHDEMEPNGKMEFLFTDRLITDEKDTALMEVTKDDLIGGGISDREATLFLCAVAASAKGDWKSTQNELFWEAK